MSGHKRACPPADEIRWGMLPPTARRQGWRRWSPRPNCGAMFWVLSSRLELVETHYWGGFTLPCLVPQEVCPACLEGRESRGKAYLLGLESPSWSVCRLVELTPYAVEGCQQLCSPKHALRGTKLQVARVGRYPNSPVTAAAVGWQEFPARFGEPDLVAVLRRMWGGAYRRLGQARLGGADDTTGGEGTGHA